MSVTKLFPAVLVGILERRGPVDLGQPVDAVIGELARAGWAGVPIGDVLDMASGIDCLEVDDPDAYTDPEHPFYAFAGTPEADGSTNLLRWYSRRIATALF